MKQREIQKCICCGQGVAHNNQIMFFDVIVRRMILDLPAIRRQHGLEMMLGACAFAAQHMGPDEDLAKEVSSVRVFVCDRCGVGSGTCLAEMVERQHERQQRVEVADA